MSDEETYDERTQRKFYGPVGSTDTITILCTHHPLSLRHLVHLCTAVHQIPHTLPAHVIAAALKASIPQLQNLDMERADPLFYLGIAKRFFDPEPPDMLLTQLVVANIRKDGEFFPDDKKKRPKGMKNLPDLEYYTERMVNNILPAIVTKKGRELVINVMEGWERYYRTKYPTDTESRLFIRHVLYSLKNVFVLRWRLLRLDDLGDAYGYARSGRLMYSLEEFRKLRDVPLIEFDHTPGYIVYDNEYGVENW